MSRISESVKFAPTIKMGLGGNLYVYSTDRSNLEAICIIINKARSSVYFSGKHGCWAMRVKSSKHRKLLLDYFGELKG